MEIPTKNAESNDATVHGGQLSCISIFLSGIPK